MSTKHVGTIIDVKGEYFLETKDPNNPEKNLVISLSSLPGKEKLAPVAGQEVSVVLSEPLRYITAITVQNPKLRPIIITCYIRPEPFVPNFTLDPEMSKTIAKKLLDEKAISQQTFKKITE